MASATQTDAHGAAEFTARAQAREGTMLLLSSSDVAISLAAKAGTLRVSECVNERLGNTYYAVEDDHGLIEVCATRTEAEARVASVVR